ncbi:MAG: helix-turn-helix domain-containing protein [Rhodococcus sp. (in: high G+C Gram-positive bacteria)]
MNDVQRITDQLAADLNRAVFVDDRSFRPLAASAQTGRVDDARVQALLNRSPTEQHLRYFAECGVTAAREALRIPGSADHGLLPRVMIPLMAGAHVLARIWLIDADPPVDEDDIARVIDAGREMRPHLLGHGEATRHNVAAGGEMLRDIQRAGGNRRQALFRQLRDDFEIADLQHTYLAVVSYRGRRSAEVDNGADAGDTQLEAGVVDTFIDFLDPPGAVAYLRGHDVVALVSSAESATATLDQIGAAAHRAATLHDVVVHAVGLGGALGSRDGFGSSLHQAEYAAQVAATVPGFDGRAGWDDLGEYRLFFAVEWNRAGVASIHRGVATLIDERRMPLAATLLAYLEREGDVNATSTALNIHRTTLYYRIERATDVLGQEPTGHAKFAIHAALRLAELAGLIRSPHQA